MADWGVNATGFNPKNYSTILAELQAAFVQAFGPGIILTDESPAGQIAGLSASFATDLWAALQDVYSSYDPDQAEGLRLDSLAKLRLLNRGAGATDAELRLALSNEGRAHIDVADIVTALKSVAGVSYAKVFVNDSDVVDANGVSPHSVWAVVSGGDDAAVAEVLRLYIVPGVGSGGNTNVSVTLGGYCRTLAFTRPTFVPVTIRLVVNRSPDKKGCPAPSLAGVQAAVYNYLTATNPPENGDDITLHLLRTAVSCTFPNVELISATGAIGTGDVTLVNLPIVLDFDKIAQFDTSRILVVDA